MKLITHNLLTSMCIAGVKEGYPLRIEATKVDKKPVENNPEIIKRMLSKVNWNVLKAEATKFGVDLPEENPVQNANTQVELPTDLSERISEALFGIEIVEGSLICPETNHKFAIKNSIPIMLVNEDKIE